MPSSAISRELLTAYEGLNISDICTAVRFVDNARNHCAHFVNHVLGVDASLTCGQLAGRAGPSANIRVHETFALCEFVGKFEDRPTGPCLAFVVQRSAVDLPAQRMQNVPQKHIGIFCDGEIWHYSNTSDKVVRQTPAQFARHFAGDGFALFFGAFPRGARALPVPNRVPAAGEEFAAPELERDQPENVDAAVWQQFLIVRHLLTGPNLRSLLDGKFGAKTQEATEAFQISAGLPVSGIVDTATYRAAMNCGFVPRVTATSRQAITHVTPAMTAAAVAALDRLAANSVFYTEELLDVDGQRIVARLEPHKHSEGTQLRFWHRGITLYFAKPGDAAAPETAAPPFAASGHAGMDTSIYPGDEVMAHLRENTNLVWTGFYLGPAPSHPGVSWMNKRSVLVHQGWGLAPLYVGQQENGPGSHHATGPQGTADGVDAIALARKAEFPIGSVLFLDIETGGPLSANLRAYLVNWCSEVSAGGYVPGAYLSHTTANSAREAVPGLKLWVFRVRTADTHADKDPPFRSEPPAASGVEDAVAWQWALDCRIAKGDGGRQLVDLDMAAKRDPSQP